MNQTPNGHGYSADGQPLGGAGYLPPGSPGLEPGKPEGRQALYIGVAALLVAAFAVGVGTFILTQKDNEAVQASGVDATEEDSSNTTVSQPGASSTITVPGVAGTAKPTTLVTRVTPKDGAKPTATTASTVATTAKPGSPTTADVCGAGVGSSVTGLVVGDPFVVSKIAILGSERRFDLVLDAGDTVQIDAFMVDFDPAIEVLDSNGNSVAFNDDGPFDLDAQVTFTVATGGFHSVYVFSADPDACGLFELEARLVAAPTPGTQPLSPPSNQSFFVELSSTPIRIEAEVVAGDRLVIYLVDAGNGTDPLISLVAPSGAAAGFDDDSGSVSEGPLDSRLEVVVAESGTYEAFLESANGTIGDAQVIVLIN